MTTRQDVIIIGAGIFGLSCAFACLERGLTVTILERSLVGSGASGGIVGAMAPHTPDGWSAKKQFQFNALLSAAAFWSRVDALSGLHSGYGRIGRIQPLADEKAIARAVLRVDGAKHYWGEHANWTVQDNSIHDDLSARIYPAKACQSLASAVKQLGGTIWENSNVTTLADGQIGTATDEFSAPAIVLAGGHESHRFLDPILGAGSVVGVKGQALLLRPSIPVIGPMIQTESLYIVPHTDGTLAIGSTSENQWTGFATDEKLDALFHSAIALRPDLANAEILARWSGIRPKARGRDPMIGRISSTNSLFVATGGFKTAFGIAHEIGAEMANLITGEPADLPASFNPDYHRAR